MNRKDTLIAANLLTVLLFVLTSVKPAGAQNQTEAGTDASTANALRLETNVRIHGPGHVTGPSEPLIDGAQTPEAIPDRLVLRVLFQTIAIPPSPSAAERDRLRVRIGRMNLDESDIETLTQVVGRFHQRLTAQKAVIEGRRQQARSLPNLASFSWYAEEQAKITTLALGAYADALQSLSESGAAKLREHVEYMKSRVTIYPAPDMSSSLR